MPFRVLCREKRKNTRLLGLLQNLVQNVIPASPFIFPFLLFSFCPFPFCLYVHSIGSSFWHPEKCFIRSHFRTLFVLPGNSLYFVRAGEPNGIDVPSHDTGAFSPCLSRALVSVSRYFFYSDLLLSPVLETPILVKPPCLAISRLHVRPKTTAISFSLCFIYMLCLFTCPVAVFFFGLVPRLPS